MSMSNNIDRIISGLTKTKEAIANSGVKMNEDGYFIVVVGREEK